MSNNATAGMSTSELGGQETVNKYSGLHEFSSNYAYLHGYIAAAVCCWGIVANIANIVVLRRKNMISSTNIILMWLAVADLLTMSSYLPVSIHFYIMKHPELPLFSSLSSHWIHFMLFHISFTITCHTVAIWLTIELAIFRYLFICWPTRGATLCSQQRAKYAILIVFVCVTILCIPNYMVTTETNSIFNSTQRVWNETIQNHTSEPYNFKYYSLGNSPIAEPVLNTLNYWIQATFFKLVPCALLTILTILLILAMHRANKRRMKLKSQGKKDESDRARETNRTTGMLLAVVALFLLTELPQGILTLCNIFITDFYEDVYMPLGDLLDIMALLNNSINFVLYCTMSRQFRETFIQVFCACCPEHRPGWLKLKYFSVPSNGTTTTGASCV